MYKNMPSFIRFASFVTFVPFLAGCSSLNFVDNVIEWFSGESQDIGVSVADPITTDSQTNSTVADPLDFPPIAINVSFDVNGSASENSNQSTTVPPSESILDDLYPERKTQNQTGYWVRESNLELDLATRQSAKWIIDIVEGTDPGSPENPAKPAEGVKVTARVKSPNNEETVTGVVGADGTVWWVTGFPEVNTYMYIQNIEGTLSWAPEDKAYWAERSILSYTGADIEGQ